MILDVVNIEFGTLPNSCMYIWVQRLLREHFDRLHPRQHREFDISSIFVSPLLR